MLYYNSMNKVKIKRGFAITGTALLLLALLFVLANLNYFFKNFNYYVFQSGETSSPLKNASVATSTAAVQPDFLEILSLNIAVPVIYTEQTTETAFQAALKNGIVHYPGTALPGQPGNCYIFGHSSDYMWSQGKYKTVFALLPQAKIGDKVTISGHQGQKFTYRIFASRKVAANDLSVLDQQGNAKRLLTLQTSYPLGTALARWVVVAELEK
jgi:LPXTG-site transpeptidase (sortase) family protein